MPALYFIYPLRRANSVKYLFDIFVNVTYTSFISIIIMNKKLKTYLVALGCAVYSLASLAFTEFISLEALIGCSIIAACFLWIAVYGSGSTVSIGCAMLITAVATITWENPNCHTFTGKLLSATGYGVIMTAATVIGILAVKELFNTLRMYYRRK